MKRILPLFFSMLLLFLSCFAATAESIELEFAIWSDDPAHLELLQEIAGSYRAEHPNVSVRFVTIQPYSAFPRDIAIRASASTPPDASWMLERLAPLFIDTSSLHDLSQAAGNYDFEDFAKQSLVLWKRGDAVYGLPFSTSPFFILYNKDLLAAAGVPSPAELLKKGEWNWERFREIAKTIKVNTGTYAYSFWMDDDSIFALIPIVRAYGGDAWNKNGTCGLNSKRSVKAMRLFHAMLSQDKSIAPPRDNNNFFAGQVAMTIAQLSMVDKLKGASFGWDMVPLPQGPAGKVGLLGQAAVVVYNAGKHKEVAADFAAYMTNKKNAAKLSRFFPPARMSVIDSKVFLNANPMVSAEQMKSAVVGSLKNGRLLPYHQNYGKIEPGVRAHFNRLLAEDADVEKIANDMCRSVNIYMK